MFFKRLYVRIWLAVVLAVAVLTLLVGWAWRLNAEPPLREVVVRNEAGKVIGQGRARFARPPASASGQELATRSEADADADHATARPIPPADGPGGRHAGPRRFGNFGSFGNGPEFVVRLEDGSMLHMHLPRPPRPEWYQRPFGFFWTLGLVAIAVALATYPIIRKLTRRLEELQAGMEQWGQGDLSVRVPVSGQDEVAFLAGRFNQVGERIETLVKSHESLLASQQLLLASQKSLLANASHELRTPLTRIRMGLELLGSQASVEAKTEISNNITELDQLVEEILLASRLDARESDLGTIEPVDLTGLVAEECARANVTLQATPQPTMGGAAPVVQGVTKLLRRAVRNLLENARRHAAGEVKVLIEQAGGLAVLRVCDRGPGVPESLRERIFEPFYRLPGATERDGGVGLGLALVKSIATRHGGNAFCEDHAGGGACFVIFLPLAT